MDSDDDIRALLTRVASGPPMRLDAGSVMARGARIKRRRRNIAVAGCSAATAAVIVVAGFLAGHRVAAPEPVQPARPGLSTVETVAPPGYTEVPKSPTEETITTRPTVPPAATAVPAAPLRKPSRTNTLAPSATSPTAALVTPTTTRQPQ